MAVTNLLAELNRKVIDPVTRQPTAVGVYDGMTDAEIAAELNRVTYVYEPVPVGVLQKRLIEFAVPMRVATAREDGLIPDPLWERWRLLRATFDLATGVASINYSHEPIRFADMLDELLALGLLPDLPGKPPTHHALLEMGKRGRAIRHGIYTTAVTPTIIAKSRDLAALAGRVAARKTAVEAEHATRMAQVTAADAEVNRLDPVTLEPVGDPTFVAAWER